ncbi:PAS domain-containing protein [Kordiimonas marina]|uniref:PAS domain-containing protein n=1 Tax=Kordiimonas marina TaxID=2872312 RepID=UPI001FF62597|nr:PAS domain-containing protein [Kordiimonas marina]MCJ9429722.1 PAS domain-containing protein [Kordiimonas marina]
MLRHSKATQDLVRFWLNLPRPEGQVCPKRSDFSSAQINGALPEVFLSEWYSEDVLAIVQAGTVLDRLLGLDITGHNIFDILPEELKEPERIYYRALRDQPCAGLITRSANNLRGKPFVYRTIQLPLLDPFGKVHYFVGTGAALEGKQLEQEFGQTNFKSIRLLERRFFDIGAGVPGDDKLGETILDFQPHR